MIYGTSHLLHMMLKNKALNQRVADDTTRISLFGQKYTAAYHSFFKIITPPRNLATQVTVLKMIFPLGNMHYIHARITLVLRLFSK